MKQVNKKKKKIPSRWLVPKYFLYFYLFLFFILILMFTYITLSPNVMGENLKEIAANRTTVSEDLIARRGNIYDNEGLVLATNVTSYTLIAYLRESRTENMDDPKHVVDIEDTAKKLSEVLNAPYEYIYERLENGKKNDRYQVEFGKYGSKLTELNKIAIENLDLPGLDFVESTKRFYPNGQFASYIIGYAKEYTRLNLKLKQDFDIREYYKSYYDKYDDVKLKIYNEKIVADNKDSIKAIKVGSTFYTLTTGKDNAVLATGILNVTLNDASTTTDIVTEGELGIESMFNEDLKGINGSLTYQRDKTGYKIPDTPEARVEATDGKDIYLTIDSTIQRFLETAVKRQIAVYKSEWMIMVAMDAKTGEILGSATSPNFNPNSLSSNMSYQNPLVSYSYEPGSVMKIYTYLCANDTGNYDGSKLFKSGYIKIGKDRVNDWNKVGWGKISYDVGFTYSSNVGAISVAKDYLSPQKLKACLKSYGFGSKTGVELSSELAGNVNFRENIDLDWLSVSFGQGLSATPIQQVQALSILANDGHMVKPHIIKKIVDNNTNEVTETKIEMSEKLASTEAVNHVKKLMYNTVQLKSSTGHKYYIKGYDLIGKTGTAQIYENGHYLQGDGNYIVSFAGMFPYNNPEIIIYTAIKKPKTSSSRAIAPYVVEVVENIAKYRNMFSEIEESKTSIQKYELKSYISSTLVTTKNELEKMQIKPIVIGDGDKIIMQYPNKGTTVLTNDKVFLLTNSKIIKVPDMSGWARSDVIKYCQLANIKCTMNGYGYVYEQSIEKDTIINDEELVLNLTNSKKKK